MDKCRLPSGGVYMGFGTGPFFASAVLSQEQPYKPHLLGILISIFPGRRAVQDFHQILPAPLGKADIANDGHVPANSCAHFSAL